MPLVAQQNSATAGGDGGSPFTLSCAGGEVLVGIKGRAAAFVDQIRGICGKVNEILMPEAEHETPSTGGTGGQPFRDQHCPSGWAIRQLRVRTGSFVDAVSISCGRIRPDGHLEGLRNHPLTAGGSGGTGHLLLCPDTLPADRLRGRSASFIDRIGLRCDVDALPAIVPANANRPDLRVAIRDYPSIVTNIQLFSWRMELWNVGGPAAAGATVDIAVPSQAVAVFAQDPNFPIAITCNTTATGARCTTGAAIPTGGRAVVRVTMRPVSGSDRVQVSATADATGQVQESNENNNTDTRTLVRVLNLQ
ncbi:MAG TPA: CARDB domain-containing protein [Vicinamibacterales bacterium]|nr:CARDB domain-containing protein [Vicinamibacterales bacterium]